MARLAAVVLAIGCLVPILLGQDREAELRAAQVVALRGLTTAEIRRAGLGFEMSELALWVDFAYGSDRLRCWFIAPDAPALRFRHRLWRLVAAYHLRSDDEPGALLWSSTGRPLQRFNAGSSPWGRLRELDPDRYQNRWEVTRHLGLHRIAFGLRWSIEAPVPGRPESRYRLSFGRTGPFTPEALAASHPAIVSYDEAGEVVGIELLDPTVDHVPASWWFASHRADGFLGAR